MNKEIFNQRFYDEYIVLSGNFNRLRLALVEQLFILFEKNNIQLGFPIQHRTKTFDSIDEKISSGRFTPKKSILEFQDLIGLRIVLLFKRDIKNLSSLIEETLTVVKKYDTAERLKEDQFGYSSLHYVVEIPNSWLNVPAFQGLSGIRAEIQIRTLSQHSWAEASNILQYKQEGSVPKQLLRSIGRVSALLETVDLEFERLLIKREIYMADIVPDIEISDEDLNVDILTSILNSRLPAANKSNKENYEQALSELLTLGVIKVSHLNILINNNLETVLSQEKKIVEDILNDTEKKKVVNGYAVHSKVFNKGVFYSHIGLIRAIMRLGYGDEEWKKARSNSKNK